MLSKSSESEMRCLVDSDIHKLIDSKTFNFRGSHPITHQIDLHPFVQRTSLSLRRSRNVKRTTTHTAASLDLPIAGNAFLVKEKVLPFKKKIIDLLPELQLEVLSLKDEGALLLKGQTYLVYVGKIDLPSHLRGHLSPKSSIGRIDLMVRGVVDGCGLYDTIPSGQKSDLWLEITPQSFNVRIRKGLALTQLMLFTSDAKQMLSSNETVDDEEKVDISSLEITKRILYDKDGEVLPVSLHRGAVVLSLSIPSNSKELAGYEAKHTNEVVNLSNIGKHERDDFFRPIRCDGKGRLTLEKDRFYILATKERISVRSVSLTSTRVVQKHSVKLHHSEHLLVSLEHRYRLRFQVK